MKTQPNTPDEITYPPIGDYALIGDCRTAALISRQGSIDWLCLPHFSGRSLFAALLDQQRGGQFAVRPTAAFANQRSYLDATNVLQTTFTTDSGVVRVIDLMPVIAEPKRRRVLHNILTC